MAHLGRHSMHAQRTNSTLRCARRSAAPGRPPLGKIPVHARRTRGALAERAHPSALLRLSLLDRGRRRRGHVGVGSCARVLLLRRHRRRGRRRGFPLANRLLAALYHCVRRDGGRLVLDRQVERRSQAELRRRLGERVQQVAAVRALPAVEVARKQEAPRPARRRPAEREPLGGAVLPRAASTISTRGCEGIRAGCGIRGRSDH